MRESLENNSILPLRSYSFTFYNCLSLSQNRCRSSCKRGSLGGLRLRGRGFGVKL